MTAGPLTDQSVSYIGPLPLLAMTRLAASDALGFEGWLAAHNSRQLRAAEVAAEAMVPGLGWSSWAASTSPRQPALGRWARAMHGWPSVLHHIGPSQLSGDVALEVRANDDLRSADPRPWDSRVGVLATLIEAGGVLRITGDGLLPEVTAFANAISTALEAQVSTAVRILGAGGASSTSWHGHDLLLVGIAGRSSVSLTGPAEDAPIPGWSPEPSGPPAWTGPLTPGDVLLVPRGWAWTSMSEQTSVWAEVVVRRMRGTDLSEGIAERSAAHASFRESLPSELGLLPADVGSVFGSPAALGARYAELDLGALVAAVRAEWVARLVGAGRPGLGAAMAALEGAPVEPAAPGLAVLVDGITEGREVAVAARAQIVRAERSVIEGWLSGNPPAGAREQLVSAGLVVASGVALK